MLQVGLVDWDLAKNYGAEIALKADVKETLRALVPALKSAGGAALESRAKQGIAALAVEKLDREAQGHCRADIEGRDKIADRSGLAGAATGGGDA